MQKIIFWHCNSYKCNNFLIKTIKCLNLIIKIVEILKKGAFLEEVFLQYFIIRHLVMGYLIRACFSDIKKVHKIYSLWTFCDSIFYYFQKPSVIIAFSSFAPNSSEAFTNGKRTSELQIPLISQHFLIPTGFDSTYNRVSKSTNRC